MKDIGFDYVLWQKRSIAMIANPVEAGSHFWPAA